MHTEEIDYAYDGKTLRGYLAVDETRAGRLPGVLVVHHAGGLGDDIKERNLWKQYMDAYEKCLGATGTKNAPWFVVPADDKINARLIVSQIVLDVLKSLKMEFPGPTKERRKELQKIRKELEK